MTTENYVEDRPPLVRPVQTAVTVEALVDALWKTKKTPRQTDDLRDKDYTDGWNAALDYFIDGLRG